MILMCSKVKNAKECRVLRDGGVRGGGCQGPAPWAHVLCIFPRQPLLGLKLSWHEHLCIILSENVYKGLFPATWPLGLPRIRLSLSFPRTEACPTAAEVVLPSNGNTRAAEARSRACDGA